MILFLLLLLVPIQIHGLDSETNDPVYKFVVVEGEPAALNASDIIEVKDFAECVDKCAKDARCVLAYQSNSSESCYLFEWDSVQQVTKNESGGVGTVAFKVYTDQPSCELNDQFLLNGKLYPLNPNDTSNFLWKIDTSEDGWTITYVKTIVDESIVCGNFEYNRPYEDGCNPECSVTMVQVSAEPDNSTEGLQDAEPTTWKECLYWCHNNTDCMVVFFDQSCKWVENGVDVVLKKREAADGKHGAIKIPLNETTCKMTTDQLLDDRTYGTPPMKVETVRDGWTITLMGPCGNNGEYNKRPYADGCNSECNFTQIQMSAFPGPLTRNTVTTQVQSWRECMRFCYKTKRCFVAYYQESNPTICSYWHYDDIFFFNRTEPSTGHHMIIKAFMNNQSCLMTTEELLNEYYLPRLALVDFRISVSYYRLQTTDKYYKFVHYVWENELIRHMNSGCQDQFYPSFRYYLGQTWKPEKYQICVLQQKWPGVTQPQAKEICKEFEGDLIPERTLGSVQTCSAFREMELDKVPDGLTVAWRWIPIYPDSWGFPDYKTETTKVWYGLEKDPADKTWKYTRQDWVILDNEKVQACVENGQTDGGRGYRWVVANQTYMSWAPGEPKDLPDYNCAYLSYDVNNKDFPFYALYSAPCNYTGVTGFSCGTDIQIKKGVRPYMGFG